MASGRRRKFFRALALLLFGLAILIAALPLWFPWILRPVAARLGFAYGRYERESYSRFRLTEFSLTNSSGQFRAKQAEAFVPTVWLWRKYVGPKDKAFLLVRTWSWEANPSKKTNSAAVSAYDELTRAKDKLNTLRPWVPQAEFTNGTVHIRNEDFGVPLATWVYGKLLANVILPQQSQRVELSATFGQSAPVQIAAVSENLNLRADAILAEEPGGFRLSGAANWLTNQIEFMARFSTNGTLPATASVRADDFTVPAQLLRLNQYQDLTGSLDANWRANRFQVNLSANAVPKAANLPPLEIQTRASGTTNAAQIDVARISAPWIHAEVPTNTEVLFHPPFLVRPVTLRVAVDLSRQPWFGGTRGNLAGEAVLRPAAGKFPEVSFNVSGSDVVVSNFATKSLQLAGNFVWPQFNLTQGRLEMADDSVATLAGGFNLQDKMVRDGRVDFSGGFGKQFLPGGVSYRTGSLMLQLGGPLNALTNSGSLRIQQLELPRAAPLQVQADWNARGLVIQQADATLTAKNSSLHWRGAADLSGQAKTVEILALDLTQSNRTELQLRQPFQASVQMRRENGTAPANSWMLDVQPARFAGGNRAIELAASVEWPEHGTFSVAARNITTDLVSDFIQGNLPDAALNKLEFAGGWTNGPLAFRLETDAAVQTTEQLAFTANAVARSDSNGISVQQVSISSATQTVFHAQASLPVRFVPGATNGLLDVNPNGPLRASVTTEPNSLLWQKIASASGLQIERPNLSVNLDGTWDAPRGNIAMSARQIQFSNTNHPLPTVTNVQIAAELTPAEFRISHLSAVVEGQPVEITVDLPLGQNYWAGLRQKKFLPDLREATARMEIQHAKLAAFTVFLPDLLSPEGNLFADVRLERGLNLSGAISLTNARTRPLADIGPVRNIEATALFSGRTVELTSTWAEIGGQRVGVSGSADLSGYVTSHPPKLPPFQVKLFGTNVPLVRQPNLLLRADLNLAATNSGSAIPTVTGRVRLRDGLFLADLQNLVPQRTASVKKRPPYFSLEKEPWADWRLNVEVAGEGFMRVQTPVFQGKVSATMKLEGTLKDPMALGEVKIDSGTVLFPFGNLDVKQGLISLTSANPYQPDLHITAGVERFEYNIKMEVTGPADVPIVQFSSTPPLSSEQIVMMLTTGKIPQGIGFTTTTQQRAQGLALFLGKNLLSEFGLGGGGENRLAIKSGEHISEAGRPTYELDYKLNDRWSIVGEYDRFDQYNLNLKWKAYSK